MTEFSHKPNTIADGGKRIWIYPQEIAGRFMKVRTSISIALLLLFYILPWCTWHENPILRLSLSSGSFFFMGQQLFIYEFYHFILLFVLAALTLFLVSALFGRVWCGYGCPQTIFIEQVLRRIETWIEGPSHHRKMIDSKKLTANALLRKVLKQIAFAAVSLSFALTFTSFFTQPERVFTFASTEISVAVALLTALAWFDGAYWREQFCHIVCPYARFQSVVQSKSTVTIGYDKTRGEPRRRGKNRDGAGDCIDCGLCVRVCPSGIDIRQGVNQLECIACARCIDGCDSIMTSIGKPQGLIRYDSEARLSEGSNPPRFAVFRRPEILGLIAVVVGIFILGVHELVHRKDFHFQLLTVPGTPFVVDGDRVKNIYTLKVSNQSSADAQLVVDLKDHSNSEAKIESPTALGMVRQGEERVFPVLFSTARSTTAKTVTLQVKTLDDKVLFEETRKFLMPTEAQP